jgi:hypothetical protein
MAALDLTLQARVHMPEVPDEARLPHLLPGARATWLGRMVNEHASSAVFDALAVQMRAAGFGDDDFEACGRFAAEERRHGVLCGAVVEALGGRAVAETVPQPPLPDHGDVPRLEAVLRNLLSISCLSETIAVALIAAERLEMPEGELRTLLTEILSDEVGHARFGWRILGRCVPGLEPAARTRLGAYLEVALRHVERHELDHLPLASCPPPEGAALGLCSGRDARTLFYETVREVILPGLAGLGVVPPARPALRPGLRRGLIS